MNVPLNFRAAHEYGCRIIFGESTHLKHKLQEAIARALASVPEDTQRAPWPPKQIAL